MATGLQLEKILQLQKPVFSLLLKRERERERENTECKSKTLVVTKTGLGGIKIQIKYPFTTNKISPDDSLLANTDCS